MSKLGNILSIAFIVLFQCLWIFPVRAEAPEYSIELTKNGFTPKKITIPIGTTVVFRNSTGRFFWPASDDHPSHTTYAEFDPKKPLAPDALWSFTFNKQGVWQYHDHISPYYTGVITVDDTTGGIPAQSVGLSIIQWVESMRDKVSKFIAHKILPIRFQKCEDVSLGRSDRIGCWEEVVIAMVQQKGLKSALAFVDARISSDVRFAADCHVYMHRIGEEYYWIYQKNRNVEASSTFSRCDMGFFHGFMQEFTSHGQNIIQAKQYCDATVSLIGKSNYQAELLDQCYHGIGHGLAFMYTPIHWGDHEKIMSLGIADCRRMIENPRECINGVYGGIAAMFWGLHGYKLEYNDADPFYICTHQKQPEALGCYNMFVPVVYGQFNLDLAKLGSLLKQIPDHETVRVTLEHAGSMPSYTLVPKTDDYMPVVEACRSLLHPYSLYCLRGFSGAIMRIGAEKEAEVRATNFCMKSTLTAQEQAVCFSGVLEQIEMKYSQERAQEYCRMVAREKNINPCTVAVRPI